MEANTDRKQSYVGNPSPVATLICSFAMLTWTEGSPILRIRASVSQARSQRLCVAQSFRSQ